VDHIKISCPEVSLLVNNAGVQIGNNLLEDASIEDLEKMQAIHITVPLLLYQALFHLLSATPGSRIINIVSIVAKDYLKETYGPYTISKYGEYGLGRMMIKEAAKHNIKVTNVILGGSDTNLRVADRPEYLKPDDIAITLLNMINSPESVYIPEISLLPQVQLL
jgi:NADP-dependent 3-hydroxy acid dehydrogenase YdfG